MSNVVNLSDHKPHLSGVAKCVKCGHEWSAVQPVPAVDPLECPECGLSHGYFKYPIEEKEGTAVFTCNFCGGTVFSVTPEYNRCVNCGFRHDKI